MSHISELYADDSVQLVDWEQGVWTHEPEHVEETCEGFKVTAKPESDAWRITSYGFVHESEHGLVKPFGHGHAMEVSFIADYDQNFDQAGVFIKVSDERWIKAGVEYSDGALQVGAVVTNGVSDWSVAPVPQWQNQEVTIRVSWAGDAITMRAKAGAGDFRLVRVIPFEPGLEVDAGPYVCAPSRAGLTVTFTAWEETDVDGALH